MAKTDVSTVVYPYGVYQLPEQFRKSEEARKYTHSYPMVSTPFPVKHPALRAIEGDFEVQKALPDWWAERVARVTGNLQFLFMGITAKEYHAGQLDERRYKIFRAMVSEEDKKKLPQSPKLGGILETLPEIFTFPYMRNFNSRGEKGGSTATAHVTWKPDEMFYMSNGAGWRSCQHYDDGGYQDQLRSAMFDTSRGIAYILTDGKTSINEPNSIIARVLLEAGYLASDPTHKPYVMLDRSYGNDTSLQAALIDNLKPYFESKGVGFCVTRRNTSFTNFVATQFMGYPYFIPSTWNSPYNDTLQQLGVSSDVSVGGTNTYNAYAMYSQCYAPPLQYTGKFVETEIEGSEE